MNSKSWPYKPNTVQIEAVQGCNRHCSFCGTAGIDPTIKKADVKTIFHTCKLIRDAGLNCRILLAGHGEPTLHPEIVNIVRTIRKTLPKNMIHMFTNGTVIEKKPELVDELFAAGLNDLVFDEYSDHRVGRFVRNDPVCQKYRVVQQGKGTPLFANKNPKEKRICIVPPIDGADNTLSRSLNTHCGAGMEPPRIPYQTKCSIIFRDFFVRYDGNIAICCNDFRGEYFVTNILACKSFEESYFHKRLESARRFLMQNDRGAIHPCDKCTAKAIRPGLLPDARGQLTLKTPTEEDRKNVINTRPSLALIVRREWERSER